VKKDSRINGATLTKTWLKLAKVLRGHQTFSKNQSWIELSWYRKKKQKKCLT